MDSDSDSYDRRQAGQAELPLILEEPLEPTQRIGPFVISSSSFDVVARVEGDPVDLRTLFQCAVRACQSRTVVMGSGIPIALSGLP